MVSRPLFAARSRARVAAAALSLLVAAGALAAPPTINALATRSDLSAADQNSIRDYASFWTGRLLAAGENPGNVRDIRRELVEPLERGGVTEVFRTTYGRALRDGLVKAMDQGNAHVSVTGVIVMSRVGTDNALNMLVDRASPSREGRRHVRLAAARGAGQLIQTASDTMVTSKDITGAARQLQDAIADEQDCFALRHQVEAIRVASEKIPEAGRPQIRGILVEALESTAQRAAKPERRDPVETLGAVYPTLNTMRLTYLQLPLIVQREYGTVLAPALEELLRVAEARWKELRETDASREQLGSFIYLCERFLATIDTIVRGPGTPETGLKQAWDDGDADRYSADLNRWRAVLLDLPIDSAPYGGSFESALRAEGGPRFFLERPLRFRAGTRFLPLNATAGGLLVRLETDAAPGPYTLAP